MLVTLLSLSQNFSVSKHRMTYSSVLCNRVKLDKPQIGLADVYSITGHVGHISTSLHQLSGRVSHIRLNFMYTSSPQLKILKLKDFKPPRSLNTTIYTS